MLLLIISTGLAIVYIILKPMTDGLMNTSMWVSKMLAPIDSKDGETTKQFLKMGQAALMDGWLSNIPFFGTLLSIASIITGCFFKWWVGIVAFLSMGVLGSAASIIFIRSVTYYLNLLSYKMLNRAADFKLKKDFERHEAAESYYKDLTKITAIYYNSGLKPPTQQQLKIIPYGDLFYWLNDNKNN